MPSGLALGIKAIFRALTLGGTASLWIAVLADMGTSLIVIVIANSLRLLRHPVHGTHAHRSRARHFPPQNSSSRR